MTAEPPAAKAKVKAKAKARLPKRNVLTDNLDEVCTVDPISIAKDWCNKLEEDCKLARSMILQLKHEKSACICVDALTKGVTEMEDMYGSLRSHIKSGQTDPAPYVKILGKAKVLLAELRDEYQTGNAIAHAKNPKKRKAPASTDVPDGQSSTMGEDEE